MANWLANFHHFSSNFLMVELQCRKHWNTADQRSNVFEKSTAITKHRTAWAWPNNCVAALGSYGLLYSSNVSHPKWKTTIFLVKVFLRASRKTPNSTTFEVTELQQKSWLAQVIGNCIMAYCYNPHTGPVPFPHLQALSSSSPVSPGGKTSREPQEWEPIPMQRAP